MAPIPQFQPNSCCSWKHKDLMGPYWLTVCLVAPNVFTDWFLRENGMVSKCSYVNHPIFSKKFTEVSWYNFWFPSHLGVGEGAGVRAVCPGNEGGAREVWGVLPGHQGLHQGRACDSTHCTIQQFSMARISKIWWSQLLNGLESSSTRK